MCGGNFPCAAPPHRHTPAHIREHLAEIAQQHANASSVQPEPVFGLNDATIFASSDYPARTPASTIRAAALEQPAFRGPINVVIVPVNFSPANSPGQGQKIDPATPDRIKKLFFSEDEGSVNHYFSDVSGGKIKITGQVLAPVDLPKTMEYYANNELGMGTSLPNCQTMAYDTATLLNTKGVNLASFDNHVRANGYVDGLIIVHAGKEPTATENKKVIWAHKWTLPGTNYLEVGPAESKKKVLAYMTVGEDAELGTCAHEFAHLVFGWPDLYDVHSKAWAGIGDWCLMSYGCHNKLGDKNVPAHPSAWCKIQQGWLPVVEDRTNETIYLNDVKDLSLETTAHTKPFGYVHKLWPNGQSVGKEYFLIENRTKYGYDAALPGGGLLVWHIDDNLDGNDTNNDPSKHFRVALISADKVDGQSANSEIIYGGGSDANPFPGSKVVHMFSNRKSWAGLDTYVKVTDISQPGRLMKMNLSVTA